MLIGRLTKDPEVRTFSSGGKVANFSFAVNNRRKNQATGEWEDEAVFIDCAAFNRGDYGKTADLVEQYLAKGSQVYLEGKLHLDKWDDKNTGEKRSKLKVVVDNIQFLDKKGETRPATTNASYQNYQDSPEIPGPVFEDQIPF